MSKAPLYIKNIFGYFPEADSVEALWKNLLSGKVAKSEKLSDYWKIAASDYQDKNSDGHISMDRGHLAQYIHTSKTYPRQIAAAIDVGRNLLEAKNGKQFGLVIATGWTDPSFYDALLGNIPEDQGYSVKKQLAKIKEELGIKGPALAVDTACASSLYALELASGMLETSKLEGVIVIGLNLYLHSFLYRGFTKLGALSKKGTLTSFDSEADGIVPGEAACGILVDTNFEGALAQIDSIGLSSDGNEGSAFGPGFHGQLAAYQRAFETASVSPDAIDYLEAHGTATVLGDDTECSSINKFFHREKGKEIVVGSSKSNIGHTLAASGLVSLIKATQIIGKKILPPHIKIKPHSGLAGKGIRILENCLELKKDKIAVSVSSFGFGGSNAHVILKTPELSKMTVQKKTTLFYVKSFSYLDDNHLHQAAPLLKNVPMGPKMQERFDKLQRHTLHTIHQMTVKISNDLKKKQSVIMLNNLGGSLSIDFERKYRKMGSGPALSIEAIASTLPSMISGNPCMLFDFRGHHMLISGMEGSLSDLLKLMPYLLREAEGDIFFGIAHKNFSEENLKEGLLVLHTSLQPDRSLSSIEYLLENKNSAINIPAGEATGMIELVDALKEKEGTHEFNIKESYFKVEIFRQESESEINLAKAILKRSTENKSIALEYLNLLSYLIPQNEDDNTVGKFLRHCYKENGKAKGELIVDETHPYFFDHPLDHVPGILSIHACEELLNWYLGQEAFITDMSIRFLKFLEKDQVTSITLIEKTAGKFEFEIMQGKKKAGSLQVSAAISRPKEIKGKHEKLLSEEKKYTHKHRTENILVSKLENGNEVKALNLEDRSPFFKELLGSRSSALYYAEVTRQFVMLMAHLRKEIPLNTKMNLILTEIYLTEKVTPVFELHLAGFELVQTEDFLLADVHVEYRIEGKSFGFGKIKAQVVSANYYKDQRGET